MRHISVHCWVLFLEAVGLSQKLHIVALTVVQTIAPPRTHIIAASYSLFITKALQILLVDDSISITQTRQQVVKFTSMSSSAAHMQTNPWMPEPLTKERENTVNQSVNNEHTHSLTAWTSKWAVIVISVTVSVIAMRFTGGAGDGECNFTFGDVIDGRASERVREEWGNEWLIDWSAEWEVEREVRFVTVTFSGDRHFTVL